MSVDATAQAVEEACTPGQPGGCTSQECKDALKSYRTARGTVQEKENAYYNALAKWADDFFAKNSFDDSVVKAFKEFELLTKELNAVGDASTLPDSSLRTYTTALDNLRQLTRAGNLRAIEAESRQKLDAAEESVKNFKDFRATQAEILKAVKASLDGLATRVSKLDEKIAPIATYATDARETVKTPLKELREARGTAIDAKRKACRLGARDADFQKDPTPPETTDAKGVITINHAAYGSLRKLVDELHPDELLKKLSKAERDKMSEAQLNAWVLDAGDELISRTQTVCSTTSFFRTKCEYVVDPICVLDTDPKDIKHASTLKVLKCPQGRTEIDQDLTPLAKRFCSVKVALSTMCGADDPSPGEKREAAVIYSCGKGDVREATAVDGRFVYLDCIAAARPKPKPETPIRQSAAETGRKK